jgi:hypothetical protein
MAPTNNTALSRNNVPTALSLATTPGSSQICTLIRARKRRPESRPLALHRSTSLCRFDPLSFHGNADRARRELLGELLVRPSISCIESDQERRCLRGYAKAGPRLELEHLPSQMTDLVVQLAHTP